MFGTIVLYYMQYPRMPMPEMKSFRRELRIIAVIIGVVSIACMLIVTVRAENSNLVIKQKVSTTQRNLEKQVDELKIEISKLKDELNRNRQAWDTLILIFPELEEKIRKNRERKR